MLYRARTDVLNTKIGLAFGTPPIGCSSLRDELPSFVRSENDRPAFRSLANVGAPDTRISSPLTAPRLCNATLSENKNQHVCHRVQRLSSKFQGFECGQHLDFKFLVMHIQRVKILSSHFSQRDHIEGCKRRECFHLDNPGGSALLSRRQTGNWTPMATIRLCTSQCPIRRGSYSLVADSADNPQISAA